MSSDRRQLDCASGPCFSFLTQLFVMLLGWVQCEIWRLLRCLEAAALRQTIDQEWKRHSYCHRIKIQPIRRCGCGSREERMNASMGARSAPTKTQIGTCFQFPKYGLRSSASIISSFKPKLYSISPVPLTRSLECEGMVTSL